MRLGECLPLRVAILASASNAAVAPGEPLAAVSAIVFTVGLAPRQSAVVIQQHAASLRRMPLACPESRFQQAARDECGIDRWEDTLDNRDDGCPN
jgi:hypothetical protein